MITNNTLKTKRFILQLQCFTLCQCQYPFIYLFVRLYFMRNILLGRYMMH